MDRRSRVKKRCFDLALGLPLAIVTIPLLVLFGAGSAISYRANPFFVQPRVGRGGRIFRFVKIRSLPPDTPVSADKYQISGVRNTRFGRFIRRFHIDELPQVWLVVFGKMSLVGPRPEMVDLSSTFMDDFVDTRTQVLPGCTGLWQVSTGVEGLINESPEYDEHYVDQWTLRLDAWILWRTGKSILGGQRLKDVGQVPTWTGAALSEPSEALVA